MTPFCVTRLEPAPGLLASDGIFRAADLGTTADAEALAGRIVDEAHAERVAVLAAAEEESRLLATAAQAQVLAEGSALLDGLRTAADELAARAEDIVTGLALQLFDRLVLDTTPQQRVAASYRRLLIEAPPRLVNAVLRMHPDEMALAEGWEWPLKADAALPPGACRLEADSGEWRADFHAAAASLSQAMSEPKGP